MLKSLALVENLVVTLPSIPSNLPRASLETELAQLLGHAEGAHFPKKLFWELLSYDRVDDPMPFSVLPAHFRGDVAEATVLAQAGSMRVCYLRLYDSSVRVGQRILLRLTRKWSTALVLFSNFAQTEWDFCWQIGGRRPETRRLMVDADEVAVRKLARSLARLTAVDPATGQSLSELERAGRTRE